MLETPVILVPSAAFQRWCGIYKQPSKMVTAYPDWLSLNDNWSFHFRFSSHRGCRLNAMLTVRMINEVKPKKSGPHTSYRFCIRISLLSNASKMLANNINHYLTGVCEVCMRENQVGFRSVRTDTFLRPTSQVVLIPCLSIIYMTKQLFLSFQAVHSGSPI